MIFNCLQASKKQSPLFRVTFDRCYLPQELKNPSTLETHKLDLLAEISNLKLKLASSERERCELEERTGISRVRLELNFCHRLPVCGNETPH